MIFYTTGAAALQHFTGYLPGPYRFLTITLYLVLDSKKSP
jgi:hypothetical protein